MRKVTDMGNVHGRHVYHVEGSPSLSELIAEGIVVAFPDDTVENGISVRFAEKCTPAELAARYTVEEIAELNRIAGI